MSLQFTLLFLLLITSNKAADLNVGTTLFTKADSCKECWSSENLALLTSRMILEDLLPSTAILLIDSNEFVSDLVEYFRLILEIVRQETHGKTKHITLLALTDLLGGYLHHAVLPIAKYAYYAGLIDYDSMSTLLGLFDELKWFLRTNGQGWAKPNVQNLDTLEIQRIPLQSGSFDKDLCQNLVFVEPEDSDNGNSDQCNAIIPMPFFDSITRPSAIALPTKTCPLHSVEANTSNYLVMKFFVTAYKCLQVKNAKSENLNKFQTDFMGWIEDQVTPRLEDEKFYAAFGGILRVRVTLKRLSTSQQSVDKQIDEFRHAADVDEENVPSGGRKLSRTAMILTAVLITIFVWFILGTLFICHKMKQTNKPKGRVSYHPEAGEKSTTCSSLISSKYFYPEKPKYKKGMSTPESDTSDVDGSSYRKRPMNKSHSVPFDSTQHHKLNWLHNKGGKGDKGKRQHEITITTCRCDHESVEGTMTPKSVAMVTSSPTEGRLRSITEISETTIEKHTKSPLEAIAPGSERMSKVQKQVYIDSESDSEETSGPA